MRSLLLLPLWVSATLLACRSAADPDPLDPEDICVENGWTPTCRNSDCAHASCEWTRDGVYHADHDGDGVADYRREQIPPGTYRYDIVVDDDHDGYFDQPWPHGSSTILSAG